MGNAGDGAMKMKKLIKYGKKLKNIVIPSRKSTRTAVSNSPPRAVCLDELFRSDRHKGGRTDRANIDPSVQAYIAAQNHFRLRHNIYI